MATLVFKRDEEIKLLKEQVKQLQDSSSYRKAVVRLEAEAEEQEVVRRRLNSQLEEVMHHYSEVTKKVEEKDVAIQKLQQDLNLLLIKEEKRVNEMEEKNQQHLNLLKQLEEKDLVINKNQEDLAYLRTQNEIKKNRLKILERQEKEAGSTNDSISEEKDHGGECEQCVEIKAVKDELETFKRFICSHVDRLSDALFSEDTGSEVSFDSVTSEHDTVPQNTSPSTPYPASETTSSPNIIQQQKQPQVKQTVQQQQQQM